MECEDNQITVKEGSEIISSFDGEYMLPPIIVQNWLGFKTQSGGYQLDCERRSMGADNDNGMPFNDLAKLFRNPPKGLLE